MDEKNDVTKSPYAAFLEMLCRGVMDFKPVKIAVVAVLPDGSVFTHSHGIEGPFDMMTMATHLQMDAMLDIAKANAREILEAAEEDGEC